MKTTLYPAALALACSFNWPAQAQNLPVVDITMAHNGASQIEVRLRPSGPFNQVVSNVVFTLRWQEQFGPALSLIEPVFPQSEYLPIGTSAIVNGGNGYLYRTYYSVGLAPMSDFGHAWEGGIEYPICTLDVVTPGTQVELVNDAFTAADNRDFFASLNGWPATGVIYPSAGTTVDAKAINSGNGFIDVLLTPQADYFGWVNSIGLTLRWPANGASLGAIVQPDGIGAALPMAKVGPEATENGYTYQRFQGQGAMSLAVAQSPWLGGEDHVLMRLPIIGGIADATVADDAWTDANNGGYAIVLNGHASAGATDELSTSNGPQFHEVIPVMQVIGDELHVASAANGSGMLVLTVLNSAGQPVAQRRTKWGTLERISMAGWASGIYTLRAQTDGGIAARRFLK